MNLLEGGNARLPSGEQAQKVDLVNLSEKQYEAFKTNIVNVIIEMNNAFNKEYGHPLFSSEAIKERKIFAGSASVFFNKSKDEYTNFKPTIGDIDVQVNKADMNIIKEFLDKSIGKEFAGWKYLGYSKVALVYCNVFKVNEEYNPQATNVQIDFNFVKFNQEENRPSTFAQFAHNSDWEDIKQNIKGVAKNALLPIIYNVVYATPGILVSKKTLKPTKNQPDDIHTKSYGHNGSREKYQPVKDEKGNQVYVDGKPAYKEMPTEETPLNTDLNSIFEEMFGKKPTPEELKKLWNYIGVLDLIEKYLNKDQIKLIYKRFGKSLDDMGVDKEVSALILKKFKERFGYVDETNEKMNFSKYVKMILQG